MTPPIVLNVLQQGQGFPILCLHGHPGSAACMKVFTDHLSHRFLTLAPDLRGYGRSQTNQPFALADHLVDLEAVLDRYQISQCLILGWSLGGILAMELALRLPERVSGLILVATSARPWSIHPPVRWQDEVMTGIAAIANQLQPGQPWHIEQFGKRSLFRYLIQRHTPAAYRYLAEAAFTAYLQTSRYANRALRVALQTRYDRLADLSAIQCPALVLAAEQDYHIAMESSLLTAQNLPNCTWYSYTNTSHLFPWEIPEQVLQDIENWLDLHPTLTLHAIEPGAPDH